MKTNAIVTKLDVLMLSLAQVGGLEKPVHIEKIVQKAFELNPGFFRWELDEFREYPDKDKVRRSLTSLEKPVTSRGVYVRSSRSSVQKGRAKKDFWQMTPAGLEWLLENQNRIETTLNKHQVFLHDSVSTSLVKQLTESRLYDRYRLDSDVSYQPYEFTDLLHCSPDAQIDVIQNKFDSLKNRVILLNDKHLIKFLDACGEAHGSLLNLVER